MKTFILCAISGAALGTAIHLPILGMFVGMVFFFVAA
jgi:putative effector of murein hydrolase LrgA (UPF0299 family)